MPVQTRPSMGPSTGIGTATGTVTKTVIDGLRRGPRWFADASDAPRTRRATDLIEFLLATTVLVVLGSIDSPQPGFSRAASELLRGLPSVFDGVWQIAVDLAWLMALVLVVVSMLRRRWRITRDLVLAAIVAVVVALVAARLTGGAWPDVLSRLRRSAAPEIHPSIRLAAMAAIVVTASPHVSLPVRRTGRWILTVAGVGVVALGASSVLGVVAALMVALIASSIVHLALGSSAGRPGLASVAASLTELRVGATDLEVSDRQQAGVFVVEAAPIVEVGDASPHLPMPDHPDGRLHIKVYGRDAHGWAVINALWRSVWYREPVSAVGLGRQQQVKHEAFVTLLARQHGVATDSVVIAGTTADDDALLVLHRSGRPVDPGPDRVQIEQLWQVVETLDQRGIAHGQIDPAHLVVHDGHLSLIDFRAARLAPTVLQRRNDRVQVLMTQVMLLGEEAALTVAHRELGAERLAEILQLLQMPTLTADQRRWVREHEVDIDALRARAAELAGIEVPELLELRRFTVGSLLRIALPMLALFAVISALSGFDLRAVADRFAAANWWLVAMAFLIGQLPRFSQAVSTLGASPVALPLGRVYALQLAVSYINLAVPGAAARMAINVRFFQRHGVPPGGALTAGAIDGFSGFLMQMLLLAIFIVFSPLSLDLEFDLTGSGSAVRLLLLLLGLLAAALAIVMAIPRWRNTAIDWARRMGIEARSALAGLRSPRRLALLFGGNLMTEVLFASSLLVLLGAFGVSVGFAEVLLVVIAVSLLAGLLPVPGGIGVSEGGLIYGLITIGVPEEVAFVAVLGYRAATFYLPPIWGYLALRWLERNKHL